MFFEPEGDQTSGTFLVPSLVPFFRFSFRDRPQESKAMAFPPGYALPSQASVLRTATVPGTGLDAVKRTSDTFDSVDCSFGGSAPRICSPARTVQVLTPARCCSPVRATSWSQDGLQLPPSWRGLTSSYGSIGSGSDSKNRHLPASPDAPLGACRMRSSVSSSMSTPIVPVVPTSAGPTVQQPSIISNIN
ncbi:hypothetical protein AK812_SmicGene14942 [Symbiodinium microadriaticum]|uniref:Uncharacterized protein n=1 Tax=Symbiodinium microadriaticum TaxID=2951 RepID=A0A1Q9E4A6_SYMMI|nr:hypothetical protein AK812_SmicGene14942 [Symbiodinium microadriaticum]